MYSTQKKLSLFVVLLVVFIDFMGIGLVYPMFSSMLFAPDMHLVSAETSEAIRGFWLGILLAMMPLTQFFSSPILGALSDQKGRKPLLKFALLVGVLGYALCMIAVWWENMAMLLFARVIIGISAGSAAVVSAAIADLSAPEEKAKNFGLLSMAIGVGFTVGPFLGGKLSEYGFDKPFLFAGIVTLLNLLLLIYFFKETHHIRTAGRLSVMVGLRNLKNAFKLPGIRVIFACVFIFCFGFSFYWEFIPVTWINLYHMNAGQIGNFYAYAAGFYALSSGLLIRPIVNRVRPAAVLFYALIVLGVYIFLLLLHFPEGYFWGYLPFQHFLIALLFPTASAMVSNWVKEGAQGEMMGILQSVQAAAFAFSPLLSGVVVGLNYDMPIIVGGIAMFLAALVLGIGISKEILKWRVR